MRWRQLRWRQLRLDSPHTKTLSEVDGVGEEEDVGRRVTVLLLAVVLSLGGSCALFKVVGSRALRAASTQRSLHFERSKDLSRPKAP